MEKVRAAVESGAGLLLLCSSRAEIMMDRPACGSEMHLMREQRMENSTWLT